jgi:GDPmannose 4,6-dehydratase
MLQQPQPKDYVVGTGKTHTVRDLCTVAFDHVGLDPEDYVQIDSSLERGKAELHDLVGDPSKARERLGWEPTVGFEELVHRLVDADLERLQVFARAPAEKGAGEAAP